MVKKGGKAFSAKPLSHETCEVYVMYLYFPRTSLWFTLISKTLKIQPYIVNKVLIAEYLLNVYK